MESKTTMSSKGQVVIPAAIREQLGLKPGDTLYVEEMDGAVRMVPQNAKAYQRARGMLKWPKGSAVKYAMEVRREEARIEEEKFKRWLDA